MQEADRIMQRGAQQMQRTADSVGGDIGASLGSAILGGLAGAISIRAVAQTAAELGKLGAETARLRQSFESLAGSQADEMLLSLQEASRGTIDDMNLMLSANRAMMLGVTSNTEEMVRLLEVAMVRGRAMGLSTQQAFNDLVTGIGRASPMILDNLGIITGGQKTFDDYAASIGKAADELTDIEKRQALLNKVLSETTGQALPDAMENIERYGAQLQRLKAAFGAGLGGEGGLVSGLAGVGADLFSALAGYFEGAQRARAVTVDFEQALDAARQSGELTTAQWLEMRAATWFAASGVELLGGNTNLLNDAMRAINPEIANHILMLDNVNSIAPLLAAETINEASAFYDLAMGASAASDALGRVAAAQSALLGRAAAMYRPLEDPRIKRLVGAGRDPFSQILKPATDWLKEPAKVGGGAGRAISEAQRLAEQRAREFQSAVESILRPTTVTGADVSATEWGAYEDKWDEYIRLLRAREDIPYYQRAEEERRFYAGLMPEQINWDAVIRDFMRKQEEEAGRQAMVQEAMRRIQEATGMAANYAAVAEAMGIPAGAVTGAQTAEALQEGIAAVDLGATVTEQFVTQMRAQRQTYVDLGVEMMQAVLEGTDEAVTPDVGKRFAKRIAPFIYDAFEAQGVTVKG